eukprot:20504-Heterococcus_DN1.PRE.2
MRTVHCRSTLVPPIRRSVYKQCVQELCDAATKQQQLQQQQQNSGNNSSSSNSSSMASLFPSMIAAFSTSNLDDDDLDFCDVTGAGTSETGVTAGDNVLADVSIINNPAFAARSAPATGARRPLHDIQQNCISSKQVLVACAPANDATTGTVHSNNMNNNTTSNSGSSSKLVLTEREKSQLEAMQTVMETAARHLMSKRKGAAAGGAANDLLQYGAKLLDRYAQALHVPHQ